MRKVFIAIFILVMALAPVAWLAAAAADVEAGKAVYEKKCAACHGKEGEGKPALAKTLNVEIRHLGSKEVQEKKDEQLRKDSVEGIGKMKPVKGLTDEDIANLMAFLRTLKQK